MLLTVSLLLVGTSSLAFAQYDNQVAVLETAQGNIVIEFFPDDAPNHVANFVKLAQSGFYDGTLFHRIIPGFMIQGGDPNTISGDPNTWGTGGPPHSVAAEFNSIKHDRGIVSMARAADPDSAGSQFFIVHQNSHFLDQQYTVFGRIVKEQSFATLDRIASIGTNPRDAPLEPELTRIISASVVDRRDVPDVGIRSQPYEDAQLGIAFIAPPGWILQKGDKADKDSPDLIAVGPKTGATNPVIHLTVVDAGGQTFDEILRERSAMLEADVEAGNLKIISQERSTINGRDASVTSATGPFLHDDIFIDVKFQEVQIYDRGKIYVLVYSNEVDSFDAYVPSFEESVDSFGVLGDPEPEPVDGGGCLIATATYGSEMAPQVQMLRELRDNKVMNTTSGTAFMAGFNQIYYFFSPTVADLLRDNLILKETIKVTITPMLATLSLLNHAEINSEYDMLGWGLAVIMLNAGMYVATPAVVIYMMRK